MRYMHSTRRTQIGRAGLTISLALGLAACAGVSENRSMNSVHQPVVEKVSYTLDLATGGSGLAYGEQGRLAGWFDAMGLKYGDRVYLEDPAGNPATLSAVEAIAGRYGLIIGEQAPETTGYLTGGSARIVIVRSKAYVPGCPDWSAKSDFNPNNGLSSNYGCATNSNFAAMIANPEDLLRGSDTAGATVSMSSNKAIGAYRKAEPTGGGNVVKTTSTKSN